MTEVGQKVQVCRENSTITVGEKYKRRVEGTMLVIHKRLQFDNHKRERIRSVKDLPMIVLS